MSKPLNNKWTWTRVVALIYMIPSLAWTYSQVNYLITHRERERETTLNHKLIIQGVKRPRFKYIQSTFYHYCYIRIFWVLVETIRIILYIFKVIYQVEFDFGISSCSGLLIITFCFVVGYVRFITYRTLHWFSQLVHVTI